MGQTYGPVDSDVFRKSIQDGDLSNSDLVWRDGWAEWRLIESVKDFEQYLQSCRPATPPPLPKGPPESVAPAIQERTFGGIEFVWCPPGSFLMGTPGDIVHEIPHKVTLTRPFWIGKYPVTQRQWLRVMGQNPSHFRGEELEAPVEQVSWDDAQAFCSEVSRVESIQFRLPSEAEWEYACRAGSAGSFCFDSPYVGELLDYAWYSANSHDTTHPVGQKKPNGWGIYDMHGNVWEWCQDWFGDYSADAVTDPSGPPEGSRRVRRGGGWRRSAEFCSSSSRNASFPGIRLITMGFRVVVEIPPTPSARREERGGAMTGTP